MKQINLTENVELIKKMKISILLLSIYTFLALNYYFVIAEVFNYSGFLITYFSYGKFSLILLITFFLVCMSMFFKNSFYKLMYSISLILFYFGQSIYYIFNDTDLILVIYIIVPLLLIFIIDKLDTKKVIRPRVVNLRDKNTKFFLVLIVLLLLVPFFQYIGTVNLKNLLLLEIYETRSALQSHDRGLLGYLFSPLTRIILPVLFIYGVTKKNKTLIGISLLAVIAMFLLNGAVKSVFFGILCAIFFISGNYIIKEIRFLRALLFTNILALFTFVFFDSYLINDYLRRIFFVPASLFNTYYKYFNENFTYFNHSKLFSVIGLTEREMPLGLFVGEYVIGQKGLNANTGIFVEGFVSFGTLGVILISCVFASIIFIIKKLNTEEAYFGVFFVYVYIINTSFIEPLLLTHGLFFLIFFSAFFIPKKIFKHQPQKVEI